MVKPSGITPGSPARPSLRRKLAASGLTMSALTAAMVGLGLGSASAQAEEVANSLAIEEIVVTARKREERLVDAPVAVAAMASEDIERYLTRDLDQLTTRIPGVQIGHAAGGGAGGSIFIRGVGNLAVDYGADQPVSLVIDGMSFSRGHMLDTGFFDLESVEVLKGPQALFFGKNSPAGVIAVTSVTPEVGAEMNGFARASYEFVTEDPVLEAGLSFPVGDTLALRVAGRYQNMQGGYLKNNAGVLDTTGINGGPTRGKAYKKFPEQDQNVVRLTAVWEPVDNFDATLKLFRSYSAQNDAGRTVLYACADGPGGNPHYLSLPDPTQTCLDRHPRLERNGALAPSNIANNFPNWTENSRPHNKLQNEMHTLEMNLELGDFTLTSLTGYWDYRHRELTNYDYTSYAIVVSKQGESGDSWTQEFRLQSDFDGPINFMVGGFYEDTFRDLDAPVQILPTAFVGGPDPNPRSLYPGTSINYHQHWDNNIESLSFFGSIDWEISEQWSVTAGARYTDEKRDSFGGNLYERGLGFSPAGAFYDPEGKADNLSPEVTVSWKPLDDVMIYAAYKTGFQSFGISNPGTVPNLVRFNSQAVIDDYFIFDETEVEGFEAGIKGYYFDGRLSADVIVYTYEYKDLQVAVFDSTTTTFSTQNAAVATSEGIEFSTVFQATEALQFRAAAQYTRLKFDKFPDAQCHTAQAVGATGPGCHRGPLGANIQDLSGERYGGPPLQVNVGATFDTMITSDWGLELTADVIHHNEGYKTRRQPNTDVPARTVTNLSARLYQQDGPWEVALICSNCANEIYVTGIGDKPLQKTIAGRGISDLTGQIAYPRLVTAQLTYHLK